MYEVFPKVLIVCGFNQKTANGITIANLFKQWPSNSIAVMEYHAEIENVIVSNIQNYYLLGNKESHMTWPFNLIQQIRPSEKKYLTTLDGLVTKKRNNTNEKNIKKTINEGKSFFSGLKMNFLRLTGLAYISRKYNISPELDKWITEFNPDIIYGTTEDIEKLSFLIKLKQNYKKKLAIHIFDDWIHSGHRYPFLRIYWNKRILKEFKLLLNVTDIGLTISQKMALEFSERYNMEFSSFHNPVDELKWYNPKNKNIKSGNELFLFVYTGIINADTAVPINKFIDAIETLNKQTYNIAFHIYSPYDENIIKYFLGVNYTKYFKGHANYQDIPNILSKADGLLLPLAFTKKSINYVRLSMPTKASEYMISGTPILMYAPPQIALSEYLSKYKAAYIHTNENNIIFSISEFINNQELREQISENAQNEALSVLTSKAVTKRLLNTFNK